MELKNEANLRICRWKSERIVVGMQRRVFEKKVAEYDVINNLNSISVEELGLAINTSFLVGSDKYNAEIEEESSNSWRDGKRPPFFQYL